MARLLVRLPSASRVNTPLVEYAQYEYSHTLTALMYRAICCDSRYSFSLSLSLCLFLSTSPSPSLSLSLSLQTLSFPFSPHSPFAEPKNNGFRSFGFRNCRTPQKKEINELPSYVNIDPLTSQANNGNMLQEIILHLCPVISWVL